MQGFNGTFCERKPNSPDSVVSFGKARHRRCCLKQFCITRESSGGQKTVLVHAKSHFGEDQPALRELYLIHACVSERKACSIRKGTVTQCV